jgi:hypothetical protein
MKFSKCAYLIIAHASHQFYRDQHSKAKKKHDVDLAAYNAQIPDAAPSDPKDIEKKKKKKQKDESPVVEKAAPKATKKAVAPVRTLLCDSSYLYQLY